jgi:hypothetical protein
MQELEDITYKEIDGKLDPNEPIYCFCNYVSYGNMVKCDNPKVKKNNLVYKRMVSFPLYWA